MLLYGQLLLIFFALPIAIAGAGLLEPEIIGKSGKIVKSLENLVRIGIIVSGVFMFMISAFFLWTARVQAGQDPNLAFALLGATFILTGGAMILNALPLRMFPPTARTARTD